MKTTNVVLGMVAAAMAGAAIGMLLAPEKGSALQKRIKDEAGRWIDEVKRLVSTAEDTVDVAEVEIEKVKSNLKPIED